VKRPRSAGWRVEERVHGQEPLLDALGVVDAIDADAEQHIGREPELAPHLATTGIGDGRRPVRASARATRSRWGRGGRASCAPPCTIALALAIDAALHEGVDRVDEVVAVLLGVEADDARAEQAGEQLFAPRADADALRVGPGDVPEGEDRRARQALADHLRREGEVVVLHEHDRIVGVDLLAHGVGELRFTRT
jgi:hypothetical protein